MKVTIIGSWGAYPGVDSATTSFLIESEGYNVLVDCGSGVLNVLQRYLQLEKLNALILSHYHKDHVSDVGCLQYFYQIEAQLGNIKNTLPIYAHSEEQYSFESLSYKNFTKGIAINTESILEIGPFQVSFCPTIHPVYNLAMKFKTKNKVLVYTGDTEWCEELIYFTKNADILISESNLYNESLGKINGHLTAGQAGELANKASVKQLVLTHLPHHGNHELLVTQAKEKYNSNVILASSGLIINI